MQKKFPHYHQLDQKDCGPTSLKIIAKNYGKIIDIILLRKLCQTNREGSSLLSLSEAAEKIGFRSLGARINLEQLLDAKLPCILHWNSYHYVVLYKIKNKRFFISDPAQGLLVYSEIEFLRSWTGGNQKEGEGVVLLLEPTPNFLEDDNYTSDDKSTYGFTKIIRYLIPYRSFLFQLIIGLLAGSILQLIFPFLTQSVVDVGIQNRNVNFVYLVLFAQFFLFIGRTALEIIRSWILLNLSTRISISILSDFFIKLMSLPISFFDVKMTGDIMQRINDHSRIERILTTSSLIVLFSLFNLIVMGAVLLYYSGLIFSIFFCGSLIYLGWILLFLKKRESLDYKHFSVLSQERSKVIELINGMQEIKLHNAERQKRWGWELLQARLFRLSIKSLKLEQIQSIGSTSINEIKNILILFFSAQLVIDGEITIGMMMAISTIVGNLNGPIVQLITFIRELQDAKISLARLSEIHNLDDENHNNESKLDKFPIDSEIHLKNVTFRYQGTSKNVLENINLVIPAKKITAIVGSSGSGKTTLMKLLLKFYPPTSGEILLKLNENKFLNLHQLPQKMWREETGTVMQEGYIFNDTVANNIAVGSDTIDEQRLNYATEVANISDFIDDLPLGFNTNIGMEGIGMSTGQKQRLLIARAVYKNPSMLLFDEATSALDANNEKIIMGKLIEFFRDRTVVVIAHRLSTVINADKIIVLDAGQIIEEGTHNELLKMKKKYYNLVKNQLELGK